MNKSVQQEELEYRLKETRAKLKIHNSERDELMTEIGFLKVQLETLDPTWRSKKRSKK